MTGCTLQTSDSRLIPVISWSDSDSPDAGLKLRRQITVIRAGVKCSPALHMQHKMDKLSLQWISETIDFTRRHNLQKHQTLSLFTYLLIDKFNVYSMILCIIFQIN